MLNEGSGSISLAYEQAVGKIGESKEEVKLKTGFYGDIKARTFSARWISYVYPSFSDPVRKTQLVQLPVDQVFDPNNVSNVDGWRLAEGTNPSDAYDASTL